MELKTSRDKARERSDSGRGAGDGSGSSPSSSGKPWEPFYPDDFCKEEFVRYRQHAWETRKNNIQGFENLLLTISGAALALSLNFLANIKKDGQFTIIYPWLIYAGWALLIATMTAIVFSFHHGIQACEEDIKNYEQVYYYGKDDEPNPWSKKTNFCNRVATYSFILGLSFIMLFAGVNLNSNQRNGETMATNEAVTNSKDELNKAYGNSTDGTKGGTPTRPTAPPPKPPSGDSNASRQR